MKIKRQLVGYFSQKNCDFCRSMSKVYWIFVSHKDGNEGASEFQQPVNVKKRKNFNDL